MLTFPGLFFKEANLYGSLLSFYGQWEKTLPSLGTSKRRVASLAPSKSYQVKTLVKSKGSGTFRPKTISSPSRFALKTFPPSRFPPGRFAP